LHGGQDFSTVVAIDGNVDAIELDSVFAHRAGDQPESFGRDLHDLGEPEVVRAELVQVANEAIGMRPADASIVLTELIPSKSKLFVFPAIAHVLQTLRVGGRAAVGNHAESLMSSQPRVQI